MTFPRTNTQEQENGSDILLYKYNNIHSTLWTYQVSQTEKIWVLHITHTI
jgi:hypothetical protein